MHVKLQRSRFYTLLACLRYEAFCAFQRSIDAFGRLNSFAQFSTRPGQIPSRLTNGAGRDSLRRRLPCEWPKGWGDVCRVMIGLCYVESKEDAQMCTGVNGSPASRPQQVFRSLAFEIFQGFVTDHEQ